MCPSHSTNLMKRSLAVAACGFWLTSCQTPAQTPDRSLGWDCGGDSLERSWAAIKDGLVDTAQAQKLANAILCLPRTTDVNDYINAHLDEEIQTSTYGTGDLEEERDTLTLARSKDRFGGYAGSAEFTYSALLDENGGISLDAQNEACIGTTVLRHKDRSGWVISEYHDACD